MSDLKDEMKKYVKTIVPENSLLIVQVPSDEVQKTSEELSKINPLLDAMGVKLLVCPDRFKFTVIKAPKSGKKAVEFIDPGYEPEEIKANSA